MMHNTGTGRTPGVHRLRALPARCRATLAAGAAAILTLSALPPFALPAMAANFTPPEGCRLEITVQNRGCTVAQHYRCSGDAPGDQWVTYFTREGATYQSRIDRETRWMESTDLRSGLVDVLEEQAADHASFSTLTRTGRDDFDFWTRSNSGERLRHVGHDALTGETVQIDGVTLEVTRFDLTTYSESGEVLITRKGQQFISRAQGRFYGGVETSEDWTGARQETNDSPVSFSFPGQPGFGSTTPEYDCDLQMVRGQGAGILGQLMKEART
ncbi:hypothetical protein [Paracoccus sp. TOH]|uniref:hypothetical protein n=1 Tax=Paracoccus sp. TOH TaxID=1263728 RepID=UPI0025B07D32|nr:hypothetical protein [Paracoccus sp. TOH]WJS83429.1 hypothetical protein NBE95_06480 [Paracoccus sp. TOH]